MLKYCQANKVMLRDRPNHFLSVCCQPASLSPNAQGIYEVIAGNSRSCLWSLPQCCCRLNAFYIPLQRFSCPAPWKWIAWQASGGLWKGKRSSMRTHLAELLLGVASVRSADLLHHLVLSDFDRTQCKRFDLQRTGKGTCKKSSPTLLTVFFCSSVYGTRTKHPHQTHLSTDSWFVWQEANANVLFCNLHNLIITSAKKRSWCNHILRIKWSMHA